MRKLLLLPLLMFTLHSFAGWEMMLCDSVDEKGNCKNKSENFTFSDNLNVTILLSNASGLQTEKVYFEISLLDTTTYAEELIGTEETKTQSVSFYTAHIIHFTKRGHYVIKARDQYKDYITSREVEVK